ncbi:MAG: O-antigen ligase family protein [Ignavibacteriales bacterium]|nr:O-antigen ligase family protein [Ignavibacteriales bacterium]
MLAMVALFVVVASMSRLNEVVFVALCLAPLIIFVVLNLRVGIFVLILALFINLQYGFTASGWFSVILLMSYLVSREGDLSIDFKHPLMMPIVVYLASVLPSLLNLTRPYPALLHLYNLVAMLLIVCIIGSQVLSLDDIRKYMGWYFLLTAASSIDVIVRITLSGRRDFGFAGIMFVDYAGLGTVCAFTLMLLNRGSKKFWYGMLTLLFVAALILNQTRSIWVVTAVSLALAILYFIRRAEAYGYARRKLVVVFASVVVFIIGFYGIAEVITPKIAERTTEIVSSKRQAFDPSGLPTNSIVTRLLIWQTAINAFAAHPIIGIGAYSFPIESRSYRTIPLYLYKRYVQGLSPHTTHLAVLVETGLVGMMGFLFFMYGVLRMSFSSMRADQPPELRQYSAALGWSTVYIALSMVVTDAWLWGHGIILMSIILGFNVALHRLRNSTMTQVNHAAQPHIILT